MKKRSLILLSLIPFALSACENEAEKNKKIFDTASGNCVVFLKDLFKTSVNRYNLSEESMARSYCSTVMYHSYSCLQPLVIFKSLIDDNAVQATSNTYKIKKGDGYLFFRLNINKRAKRFYLDHCISETISQHEGTVSYETFYRLDASYDYSTDTVKEISMKGAEYRNEYYKTERVSLIKLTNSNYDSCWDQQNECTEEESKKFLNDYVTPFKKTFAKAKENSEDYSEKFSKIVNDLYDELIVGGFIYY